MRGLLATCPGLLGDIARYINNGLISEQPGIAFAAALSFMGALMSGRVASDSGVEPNIYSIAVAETGIGKSQAQSMIRQIVDASGLEANGMDFLMGKPASDAGLMTALSRSPRRLFIWDELGIGLSALSGSKNSHEAMILSQIMELYSEAGKPVKGKEYSTKGRVDINGAYLSIFGSSAPNRFFGALNQSFLEDGFLPRFFLFFQEPYKEKKIVKNQAAFDSIVERVRECQEWRRQQGNLSSVSTQREKIIIPIKNRFLSTWVAGIRLTREQSSSVIERVFWSRAVEQANKVALCLSDTGQCDDDAMMFSAMFMSEVIQKMIDSCAKNIYANSKLRDYNDLRDRFENLLKPGQAMTKADIYRLSRRWCTSRDRDEILDGLIQDDIWTKQADFGPGRKSTTFFCKKSN